MSKLPLRTRLWQVLRKHWKPVAVVLGPLLLWLLSQFIDYLTGDWLSRYLWNPIATAARTWAARPIGAVGVIVLFWTAAAIVILALVAFGEKSKTADRIRARLEKRRKRSREEEILVADIREVWERSGYSAVVGFAEVIFNNVVMQMIREKYWGHAMQRFFQDYRQAQKAFTDALDDRSAPLKHVRDTFNKLYEAYRQLMYRFADMHSAGDTPQTLNFAENLDAWRSTHRQFRERLHRLVSHVDHRGTLTIYTTSALLDEPYKSFLREAGEFDD